MKVHCPTGLAYLSLVGAAHVPTWTLAEGYGFVYCGPTPAPPRDEQRERKERR